MKQTIYLFLILFIFTNVNAENKLSFNRDISMNASDSSKFFADVGAGYLAIQGGDVDEITVKAKIYSNKYGNLDDLQKAFDKYMLFSLERKGSKLVLKAIVKKRSFSFSSPDIAIDLDIIVPRSLNIEIDDGSGNLRVFDIDGKLEIDDGSGSMVIKNIGDNITIDDGSGNLEITNVDGDVRIDDGSGNQIIRNIKGSIYIDDGSGVVDIVKVTGDVSIDDSSGSIKVSELAGNFNLIDDGSGSVHVNGKKWNFD
jgi:hypothetical protein